jgi:hypothetical protein
MEGKSMSSCHREATLEEILADPVTIAVLDADGVDPQELTAMLNWVVRARMQLNPRRLGLRARGAWGTY